MQEEIEIEKTKKPLRKDRHKDLNPHYVMVYRVPLKSRTGSTLPVYSKLVKKEKAERLVLGKIDSSGHRVHLSRKFTIKTQ